jgi:predicted metalloprotease
LAREYGAATIGTVLAHEFAHAIQLRIGALDRALPTIATEQQADCFAGAWTGRTARGEATTVRFSDGDVRAGVIAMTKVSDPVGVDQFEAGGHGSGFDRVGAFQVGFNEGPARCAELLDDPLPLMPNQFTTSDFETGGNAAFGYGENDLIGFLPEDLNRYWDEELDIAGLDPLTVVVVDSIDEVSCDDLRGDLSTGTALCAPTSEVYFNEPAALELYRSLGDFAVGYVLGNAWSEAVQTALGSDLDGEPRALLNDCLTGGWVKTVTPIDFVLPQPRLATRISVSISAGDLDEAIQTVLRLGDAGIDDDVIGNAFEKIDAFRTGVIEGTDSCLAQL